MENRVELPAVVDVIRRLIVEEKSNQEKNL